MHGACKTFAMDEATVGWVAECFARIGASGGRTARVIREAERLHLE